MHELKSGAPRVGLALCLACAVGCAPKALTAKTEPAELERTCLFWHVVASCKTLGEYYEAGKFVDHDMTKAAFFYERGCRLGDIQLCVRLGIDLDRGEQLPRDSGRAVDFFRYACSGADGNPNTYAGCTNLGVHLLNGDGIGKDEVRAASLFDRGCKGGWRDGCYWIDRKSTRLNSSH